MVTFPNFRHPSLTMKGAPTDQELLNGLRAGRKDAFTQFYWHLYPMIRFLVVNNSGSSEEADDVFQDGVLVMLDKLRKGEFQLTASLKTYFYSVCRNLWLKRLRQKGKTTLIDFENPIEIAEEPAQDPGEGEQVLRNLRECLETIGDACRRILERFYYFKMSMEDIAAELGYTNADTVKTQKYKCILRMRKLMEEKNARG